MSDFYLYPNGTFKPVTRGKPPKDAIRVKEGDPRLSIAKPLPIPEVKPSQEHMDKVSADMEEAEQENVQGSGVDLDVFLAPGPDDTPKPFDAILEDPTAKEAFVKVTELAKPIEAPKVEGYLILDHDGVKRYTPEEFEKLPK